MGQNLEMTKAAFTRTFIFVMFALLITQCGNDGETKHLKYIAHAEWSPASNSTIIISKDEHDETTGKTSGCGNDVYVEPRLPSYDIFLADTSGKIIRQITANKGFTPPFYLRWSPDGSKFLIFGGSISTLMIVDTTGKITLTDSLGYTRDADWSPDGSMIVCSAVRQTSIIPRLYTVNPTDGQSRQIFHDSIHTGAVSWSAHNKVAFAFSSDTASKLAVIDPDGSNFQLRDSGGFFNTIRWSPDGNKLLYSKRTPTQYDAYILDILSSNSVHILRYEDNTNISSLRFSPDGTMISYYVSNSPDKFYLYVMNVDGTNNRLISNQSTEGSWSPDSKSIVYVYFNAVYTKRVR